ncbi:MAG: zinc ribbon domain-containing protein [Bacteroidales bacterium]|jgi:hypothetical protein|nr:zinc ribbon domain-containing protein [Bacteroidales bacterium]
MNCPKCNAELKPGARFCHVCGFDTQSAPAPSPVNPTQTQNTMEQNTNTTPQQPQGNEPFDMNKVPKTSWIYAGIAALGAIGVLLPWVRVSFWGMSSSASGIEAWQGIFAFIVLLAIAVIIVAGNAIKLDQKLKDQVLTYGAYVPALFSVWVLIDILGTSMVQVGFGLFITLLCSVALILIGHKVIKLK